MRLQPSEFQRRTVVSEIFTLILKQTVNLKKGKMALLAYRAVTFKVALLKKSLIEKETYVRTISTSKTVR